MPLGDQDWAILALALLAALGLDVVVVPRLRRSGPAGWLARRLGAGANRLGQALAAVAGRRIGAGRARPKADTADHRSLRGEQAQAALQAVAPPTIWARSAARLGASARSLPGVLFAASLGVYLVTRLVGLERFPIYFFADEAIQTLQAADFLRDGLRDFRGRLFPTYFQNASYFNLSTSVYVQVIPTWLFGQSLAVTRGTAALLSSVAAVAASLTLKSVFRARWWWLGALLLSIAPAWFLHSRTAFETVLMTAAYAAFVWLYLLYRVRHPRYLYPALVCGALAFYSYSGGQLVVALTGLGLLVSDLRYHWAHRRIGLRGLALLALLVLPYARFLVEQPGESYSHLRMLNSYWVDPDLTLAAKLAHFGREYGLALSPAYWFAPDHPRDLVRHVMRGYGHMLPVMLPFVLLGLVLCLWHIRRPEYRALLVVLLAAPAGGAMTAVGITRVLVMVVPLTLLAALGLEALRARYHRLASAPAAAVVFAAGAVFSLGMLADAVTNGPLWYRDYGMGGMQWGGRQVTSEMRAWLQREPDLQLRLTPVWTNGADYVVRFFLPGEPRVRLENLDGYLFNRQPLDENVIFVMLAEEYQRAVSDPKLTAVRLEQVISYPDGSDGFLFVRLAYSPEADALFAAERAERQQPLTEMVSIDGEEVTVSYSRLDAGRIQDIFDDDAFTLGRTQEANPAIFDLVFKTPRALSGVSVTTGSMDVRLRVMLFAGEDLVAAYERDYTGLPQDPTVQLTFDGRGPLEESLEVTRLRLEVEGLNQPPTAKIHVREILVER
jgi:hypothetical protein